MYFRNQKKTAQDVSMNEPIDTDSEGNPLTLSDIIYTEDTIADDLDTKIKIERLRRYIQEMPATREKEIIVRRYGLDGNFPETQREIAERLHISRSYVSRIEKRVLQELRKKFAEWFINKKAFLKRLFFVTVRMLCAERKTGWFSERDSRQFFRNSYILLCRKTIFSWHRKTNLL